MFWAVGGHGILAGFIADKGKDYALRSNTLTYGWTAPEGTPSRDPALIRRFHPMPQYDTTSPMGSGWTWQVALANGSYPVIVVMGDATSRHHTNNVVVQGQAQSDPDPYDAAETQSYLKGDFDGYAVQATVTDGILKIESGADALDPVICYLEVGPEGMQLTDEMRKRLADEIQAATNRTGGKPYGKGEDIEVKSLVYSGDYVDEPLMVEAKSGRYFIHGNQQYSVMAISNAAGEVVERRQYGPYGEIEVNEEGVPPVELSVGYTGREWDADVGMYYFRARWYSPKMGRFVNRDPLGYVDGKNLYCGYFAPGGMDPEGKWSTNVHKDLTEAWAVQTGYLSEAARRVGEYDEGVDGGLIGAGLGFAPWGDQSYHFNRTWGGGDSRLSHFADHVEMAKMLCDFRRNGNDDDLNSLGHLGVALHPLQDFYAHGDYGRVTSSQSSVWSVHNSASLQTNLLVTWSDVSSYPDIVALDAVGGDDGRPAGRAMRYYSTESNGVYGGGVYEYAEYETGTRRIQKTREVTLRAMLDMKRFIKDNAKPCGRCAKAYGVER